MEFLVGLFVILFVCCKYLDRIRNIHNTRQNSSYSDKTEDIEYLDEVENVEQYQVRDIAREIDYANSYQARYLLSKNEWHQYMKLKDIAAVKGLVICPKVRLLDIIEPKKDEKKYKTLFYKIQAKHVDFLICDNRMHIKAIIELDDSSHDTKTRKERDEFVDTILRGVGYKVIHTKYVTNDILDSI